jgi:hypothetical protein
MEIVQKQEILMQLREAIIAIESLDDGDIANIYIADLELTFELESEEDIGDEVEEEPEVYQDRYEDDVDY